MKNKGFTLIELLIVIVIVGVLSGLTIPRIRSTFSNFELKSFSKDLFYLAHYLQSRATSEGEIYLLKIDKEKGEFQPFYKKDEAFLPLRGKIGAVMKAPEKCGIILDPAQKTDIFFYPDASVDNIKITLKNDFGRQISVIIKGATSAIKIE